MYKKRRSMLGRRHLLANQHAQTRPAPPQAAEGTGYISREADISWRGRRSEKKQRTFHLDKASKEFKKCLFSKSPGVSFRMLNQDRNHHSSNENLLNETGISSIAPTPSSTPRDVTITPAVLQQRRAELEKARYGPLLSAARNTNKTVYESDKPASSSISIFPTKTSYINDFDHLKPPDSPPPSRLERILLEEKLTQNSSSIDFFNLKPPDSPPPSRLDRILLEEKLTQNSSSIDFNNLKPPDSPGPSRLDKLIMEEKRAQNSSCVNFYDLKPPNSPGPSRLDRLIMEKKLEQPLDPDLKKMQSLNLSDLKPRLQFSPPLSSTCIASPDSGKKNSTVKEEIKETALCSGRKLSTIKEDCDVSVIEFQLNERTILELDNTLMESTINNTVKPNNASRLENILEDQNSRCIEENEPSWENMMARLNNLERAAIDSAINHANEMNILKKTIQEKIETIQKKVENESLENISNIRLMKKTLESLKHTQPVARSTENKENHFSFRVPTTKKKQLDVESKWFNSVKKENPGLLKTPNAIRKINRATLTPRSFTQVLQDQMNELYDN